jgi:tetratricopeptide (TPR) repeat protein
VQAATIKSGKITGKTLASLFYERAGAYYGKGDCQHAIEDYNEATKLSPTFAIAFNERGFAKHARGNPISKSSARAE